MALTFDPVEGFSKNQVLSSSFGQGKTMFWAKLHISNSKLLDSVKMMKKWPFGPSFGSKFHQKCFLAQAVVFYWSKAAQST